jgi:hypothetical protein
MMGVGSSFCLCVETQEQWNRKADEPLRIRRGKGASRLSASVNDSTAKSSVTAVTTAIAVILTDFMIFLKKKPF